LCPRERGLERDVERFLHRVERPAFRPAREIARQRAEDREELGAIGLVERPRARLFGDEIRPRDRDENVLQLAYVDRVLRREVHRLRHANAARGDVRLSEQHRLVGRRRRLEAETLRDEERLLSARHQLDHGRHARLGVVSEILDEAGRTHTDAREPLGELVTTDEVEEPVVRVVVGEHERSFELLAQRGRVEVLRAPLTFGEAYGGLEIERPRLARFLPEILELVDNAIRSAGLHRARRVEVLGAEAKTEPAELELLAFSLDGDRHEDLKTMLRCTVEPRQEIGLRTEKALEIDRRRRRRRRRRWLDGRDGRRPWGWRPRGRRRRRARDHGHKDHRVPRPHHPRACARPEARRKVALHGWAH
jgi:hypothetical protein